MDNKENKIHILKGEIRLDIIVKTIWNKRKSYIIPLVVTFVVSSFLALSMPRYYTVEVMLAPEYTTSSTSLQNGIGGLASAVGLRLGNTGSTDAIVPMFYPDLMKSTDFLVPLLNTKVKTKDGSFEGTYQEYLLTCQKAPWWSMILGALKSLFAKPVKYDNHEINPFELSRFEDKLIRGVAGNINCTVDKKTDVISISTTAQDPLVAALFTDTVKEHLQNFIIDYRTKKARKELERINMLYKQVKGEYEKMLDEYASFVDSNQELVLQTYQVKKDRLENEAQIAYNAYSLLMQQKYMAEAKVTERIPAFTTVQNTTVPVRHSGPKRTFFVLTMLMLVFLAKTVYILVKEKSISY